MERYQVIQDRGFSAEIATRSSTKLHTVEEHSHKFHELYILLEGKVKYWINDEFIEIPANHAAFVREDYIHKATYDYHCHCKRFGIWFTTAFVDEPYRSILEALDEKKVVVIDTESREQINWLMRMIMQEFEEKKENWLLQCKNLLHSLLVLLDRQNAHRPMAPLTANEQITQAAAQYISTHLDEDLSLKALAGMYAMSPSHFSRIFSQYTGVGVARYIKLARLRQAEKMLQDGQYSIKEIAIQCGFSNSNYFISEFKKHKGVTPFKYASYSKEK